MSSRGGPAEDDEDQQPVRFIRLPASETPDRHERVTSRAACDLTSSPPPCRGDQIVVGTVVCSGLQEVAATAISVTSGPSGPGRVDAGRGRRSAEDAVAETGADMTRFATGGHLVSWAGRAPLDKQSGKRKGQGRHKKGNTYLGGVLGETAICAGRTQTRRKIGYHVRELEALGLESHPLPPRPSPGRPGTDPSRLTRPRPQPTAQTAAGCCRAPS